MNYSADIESLNVNINWNTSAPRGSVFKPEKIILLYSENNQPYKFVNKYCKFHVNLTGMEFLKFFEIFFSKYCSNW